MFRSQRWQQITETAGITLQLSGVESHNSIGLGERYHAPLRRFFNKIRYEAPKIRLSLALRLAQKVMNETMGAHGLVPSLCVFGVIPRFPAVQSDCPTHRARMIAIESARREMERITAELRVRQALISRVPPAAQYVIAQGDLVRVYREGDKRFLGPFPVLRVAEKEVFVNQNGRLVHYNISQVVPHQVLHRPNTSLAESHMTTLRSQLQPFVRTSYLNTPPPSAI